MKAGMILGIIASVIFLLIGIILYFVSGVAGGVAGFVGDTDSQMKATIIKFAAIILPIAALIASCVVYKAPRMSAGVLGGTALLVLLGGFNGVTILLTIMFGTAAALIMRDSMKPAAVATTAQR